MRGTAPAFASAAAAAALGIAPACFEALSQSLGANAAPVSTTPPPAEQEPYPCPESGARRMCCTESGRRNLAAPCSSSMAARYQCLYKKWPQGGPPRPQNRVQKSAAETRPRSHNIGPSSILKPKQKQQATRSRGHITAYGRRP
jgi:hypothetical protein